MLRRAVHSVLGQTLRDFRLCIYDDASEGETEDVCRHFERQDSRVEWVRRPVNLGRVANMKDATGRVETPFFSILPDDDLMLPEFLETAMAGFRRHPEAALSILSTLNMTPRGFLIEAYVTHWPEGLLPPPIGLKSALRYGNPGLPSMLIRKEVWAEFGGFDEDTEPSADMDFELRVGAHHPVVVSRKPGGIQVVHPGSITVSKNLEWIWPCGQRMIAKFAGDEALSRPTQDDAVALLSQWVARSLVTVGATRAIARGQWSDAEKAAEIVKLEFGDERKARAIRTLAAFARAVPGTRTALLWLLALRNVQKVLGNLALQFRFRSYSKVLRVATANAQSC